MFPADFGRRHGLRAGTDPTNFVSIPYNFRLTVAGITLLFY